MKSLNVLSCPSLSEVDARNVTTLTGSIDLSNCPRLKSALFGGSSVGEIILPKGSKIETFELPDTIKNLSLVNLPKLEHRDAEYEFTDFIKGVYYITNQGVGNKCNLATGTQNDFCCARINCKGAKSIMITGLGGSGGRLWCFLDANDIILSVANATITSTNQIIEVPHNAVTLIVNASLNQTHSLTIYAGSSGLQYNTLQALTYLRVENNANISGYGLLKATIEDGANLTNIRIIGFDYDGDATDLDLLAELTKRDEFGQFIYQGIDSDGSRNPNILPVIEGTLNISTPVYEDSLQALKEAYGNNLVLNITGGYFVRFQDPEVQRICAENWGDGIGITTKQIEAVTDIGTVFKGNAVIESFDEFGRFKNATILKKSYFQGCTNLKSIDLSEITELIGGGNFSDVPLEGELNMPKLVNIQASGVFDGQFRNNKFTKIINLGQIPSLPNGYNTTTLGTFGKSSLLEEVVLPETLETIGKYSFYDCFNLRKVNIDKLPNLRVIGMNAFVGCDLSETSLISDSIEEIGANAFKNAANLSAKVSLPKLKRFETTSARDSTIFGGTGIVEVADLGEITTLYNGYNSNYGAFNGCKFLTKVNLPNTLTQIGQYSFRHCTALSSINFHTAITIIEQEAFYNCTSLEIDDLQLPNLETLGQNAFYGVKIKKIGNLGKITALPTASTSTQNFGDKSVLEEVVLPEGVISVPKNSFYNYTSLKYVQMPNIQTIAEDAFLKCSSLTGTLNLPNLTSIGAGAFSGTAIEYVDNLGTITNIPAYTGSFSSTFQNCSKLKRLILPETITSIGNWMLSGCTTMEVLICRALTPPTFDRNPFYNSNSTFIIYVPDASVEAYKTASGWSSYADRIKTISKLQTDNPTLYEEIKDYLN